MAKIAKNSLFFIIAAILVNLDFFFIDSKVDVFYNNDENWYGIVLQNLERGTCDQGIPVTFEFPDRKSFHSCRFFKILNAASPFEDFYQKTIFLKASARILTLALFFLLGTIAFQSGLVGMVFGTWFLLDSGFGSFKPIISNIFDIATHTEDPMIRSTRYISPLHYMLPGLGLVYAFLQTIVRKRIDYWNIAIFCICGYLLSIVPFYAFLPFLYWLGALWIFAMYFSEKKVKVALTLQMAVLIGLIGLYVFPKLGLPFQKEALQRSGFITGHFAPIFVGHKALIALTILWLPIVYGFFRGRKFPTLLVVIGPYVMLNLNIFTGIEYQNFHFADYLAPIMILSILAYVYRLQRFRKAMVAACITGVIVGAVYTLRAQISERRSTALSKNYVQNKDILDYLANTKENKNIFCHELYMYVPLESGNRCLWHHLLMTYPISGEELMHITMADFHWRGYSTERALEEMEKEIKFRPLATYSYGNLNDWFGDTNNPKRFADVEKIKKTHTLWTDYFEKNGNDIAEGYINKIDYFIFSNTQKVDSSRFRLVEQFKNYGLFEKY